MDLSNLINIRKLYDVKEIIILLQEYRKIKRINVNIYIKKLLKLKNFYTLIPN